MVVCRRKVRSDGSEKLGEGKTPHAKIEARNFELKNPDF